MRLVEECAPVLTNESINCGSLRSARMLEAAMRLVEECAPVLKVESINCGSWRSARMLPGAR